MSVTCYFGATEHGKSWHVANNVVPLWKKVVIFDPTESFEGSVYVAPDMKKIMEIFRKFSGLDSYRIVIRTNGYSNDQVLSNRTIHLALCLGTALSKVSPSNRLQMIVDEAGSICSPHYQSAFLKRLVTKGRHVNVDSHFIVQNPMAINNKMTSQATKICSFFLGNALSVTAFNRFSREICQVITTLPKYYRFEWSDNEEAAVFDQKNKIVKKFPKKTSEFLQKNKGNLG